MSSLVSTGNCKLGHDCRRCVHTDDTTKLSPTSCEFVFTPPTPARQNSFVPSASAVCIGHNTTITQLPWSCIFHLLTGGNYWCYIFRSCFLLLLFSLVLPFPVLHFQSTHSTVQLSPVGVGGVYGAL